MTQFLSKLWRREEAGASPGLQTRCTPKRGGWVQFPYASAIRSLLLLTYIIFLSLVFLLTPSTLKALISLDEEEKIGKEVFLEISKQVEFVEDVELVGYLHTVGEKLREKTVFPLGFKFFLVNDPTFNAYSLPGGYILVNTGIFNSLETEDELAGILAHEMAHNVCRHIARRLEDIKKMQVLTTAATLAGIFLGGEKGIALGISSLALAQTRLLSYSRADEEEADRTAAEIMINTGYNPWGMVKVMEKLSRKGNLAIELEYKYLLTHPLPQERVTYLLGLAQKHTPDPKPKNLVAKDPVYLKRIFTKLQVLSKKHDLPSLVNKLRTELLNENDPWKRYTLGLALAEQRFFKEAIEEMSRALKDLPQKPYFLIDLAEIYVKQGNYQQALRLLNHVVFEEKQQDFLRICLAKLNFLKAKALLETGNPSEAYSMFVYLLDEPFLQTSHELYLLLGKSASMLEKWGEAHFYFGRHYQLKGEQKPAVYHYERCLSFLPKTDKMYLEAEKALQDLKKRK